MSKYIGSTNTDEDDTMLDPTMGSGSCGEACLNLNRKFIGIERDEYGMIMLAKD